MVGQREQRRYCLTRRHATCPLFPSPPLEETPLAVAPEPVTVGTERPEVAASLPQEPLVVPRVQERPAEVPVAVLPPDTVPESMTREAVREPISPPIEREMIAGQPPRTGVAAEESRLVEEPAPAVTPEIEAKAAPLARRALPWAAAGLALVVLACIAVPVALYLRGAISGVSPAATQLSSLCPGSLLLVSGGSFVGAAVLLGLLFWGRRRSVG